MQNIAREIDAEASLVRGQPGGPGVILSSATVNYRRPVTFPDTLFVAHRVKEMSPTQFILDHMCYSLKQQKVVTTGTASMVMYDYGALKVSGDLQISFLICGCCPASLGARLFASLDLKKDLGADPSRPFRSFLFAEDANASRLQGSA